MVLIFLAEGLDRAQGMTGDTDEKQKWSSPTMWRGQGRSLQRSKVVLIREAIWMMDKLTGKAGWVVERRTF